MATDDGQERTEQATDRRLEKERDQGHVPYSKEAGAALLLFLLVGALKLFGGDVVGPLRAAFTRALSLESYSDVDGAGFGGVMSRIGGPSLAVAASFLIAAFAVAALAGFLQLGVSFNTGRLQLKFEKLNPVAGFGKLFNRRSLMMLAVSAAKVTAVSFIAWSTLRDAAASFSAAPIESTEAAAGLVAQTALLLTLRVALFSVCIALFDLFWQRLTYKKDVMMSKQDVKEEHKQAEGDDRVKAEIKRRMKQLARYKMIKDVRKATVVVRNPTHFAVALRYDKKLDSAPFVLAKGQDHVALRIIAEAEKHRVPCVAKPELARELYRSAKVGAAIPPALYKAVAAILAYVMRSKNRSRDILPRAAS